MAESCGARQCIFCAFANIARLHPQRLALLQPQIGTPCQADIHRDASGTNSNRNGDHCQSHRSKSASCLKQTRNDARATVESSSDSPAQGNLHPIRSGDNVFSYSTLLDLANKLAEQLRTLVSGLPSSAPREASQDANAMYSSKTVGILIGPSVDYVVAILAVLQCGFAFLPLDPSWPARRIATVVADSEPFGLLIDQQGHDTYRDVINNLPPLPILRFDLKCLLQVNRPLAEANVVFCPCFCHSMPVRPYCYVLYTSGSSGKPKGVLGTEKGLLHRLQWMHKEYPFLKNDVAIFKTSVAFIDHLTELLGPLLGGSLVLVPPFMELSGNPLGLLQFLDAYNVTRLTAVPSLVRAVFPTLSICPTRHAFLSIQVLVLSGEVLPCDFLKLIQALLPHATILNLYGCTEVSGDCLCFDCGVLEEPFTYPSVPIGKPLPGCMVEIASVDSEHGDEGELWVGGELVALGYHNDMLCRDETFNIGDRFTTRSNPDLVDARLRFFKTGDFVKRLRDGNLLFMGRKDRTVKMNGNKVNLDEIEIALGNHCLVARCAVSYQKVASSDSIIVAHIVLNALDNLQELACVSSNGNDGTVSFLKAWLGRRLSKEMIPGRWVVVETLPYLSSGKIDYQALLGLEESKFMAAVNDAPAIEVNSLTSIIKRAFELVLKLDTISIHDDFFSLGGTSVSAAHVAHILGIDMRSLYTRSSVIELVPVLSASWKEVSAPYSSTSDLEGMSPVERVVKRFKVDQIPNASSSLAVPTCNEQKDYLTFGETAQFANWPEVHKDNDGPQALFRCNICMPRGAYLLQRNFLLSMQSLHGLCSLSVLWKVELKACVDASPVLLRHHSTWLACIGSHACNFVCINTTDGNVVWEEGVGGRIESTAAITADIKHVLVGSYDGFIHVFNIEKGAHKWKFQTKAEVKSQPTVDGRGFVWCGSHDHHLYVLDVEKQKCVWEYDCDASIFGAAAHDSTRSLTYIATTAGTVIAFRTYCPEPQITWMHVCGAPIFGSLAVDDVSGFLISTLVSGKVMAFSSSGSVLWEYTTGGPVFAGATLTASLPAQVLVCSRDNWVYSLHLSSGKCLWKYCLGEPITSSIYVDESLNLVSRDACNSSTHHQTFQLVCACGSSGRVSVFKVYAGSTQSSYPDMRDIQETWNMYSEEEFPQSSIRCELVASLKLPGDIFSSPIMLGGRIFVGCRDNNFYCLKICGLDLQSKAV